MGEALTITIRRERGLGIVEIAGAIDISTVSELREPLFELADSGQPLVVDLDRVAFIDSTGLGALVGASRRAAVHGHTVHAVCARPQTRRLLWLTGVDRRIPLSSSLQEAVTAMRNAQAPGAPPEAGPEPAAG